MSPSEKIQKKFFSVENLDFCLLTSFVIIFFIFYPNLLLNIKFTKKTMHNPQFSIPVKNTVLIIRNRKNFFNSYRVKLPYLENKIIDFLNPDISNSNLNINNIISIEATVESNIIGWDTNNMMINRMIFLDKKNNLREITFPKNLFIEWEKKSILFKRITTSLLILSYLYLIIKRKICKIRK